MKGLDCLSPIRIKVENTNRGGDRGCFGKRKSGCTEIIFKTLRIIKNLS